MEKHVAEAIQNYAKGYTCSQAVMCAFADDMGIDRDIVYKMIEGFGGGCGGMQEVCGALSAAFAVISFHYSDGKLEGGESKLETYAKIREAADAFREKFGAIVCRDVLNGSKPQPFKCGEKVRIAAEIVNQVLGNRRI